jgi:hypothetical protein
MQQSLDVGATLSRVFDLYRQQAAVLLPAAALIFLLPALATVLLGSAVGLGVIVLVVALVAGYWYQGVVVTAVQDMEDGRRDFSIGRLFSSAAPFVLPLAVAGLLAGIGIVIGLFLLIVPGLLLMTWWALLAPVIVLERSGIGGAFGRSRELVRGNGWQVFAIIVLLVIVQAVVSGILSAVALAVDDSVLSDAIGSYVGNVLVAPLAALAATVVYLRLREAYGGAGALGTGGFAPPQSPTPDATATPAPQPAEPPSGGAPLPGERPGSVPPPATAAPQPPPAPEPSTAPPGWREPRPDEPGPDEPRPAERRPGPPAAPDPFGTPSDRPPDPFGPRE